MKDGGILPMKLVRSQNGVRLELIAAQVGSDADLKLLARLSVVIFFLLLIFIFNVCVRVTVVNIT